MNTSCFDKKKYLLDFHQPFDPFTSFVFRLQSAVIQRPCQSPNMSAPSSAASGSSHSLEHAVHVYIDNAHLWMHGQNLFATRAGFMEWNAAWRFDVGRLQTIVAEKSGLQTDQMTYSFQYYLHGPVPPVDTVWGAADPHNVHLGQSPDLINAQITTDSVATAVSASFNSTRNTFIIVSGDNALFAAVKKIQNCGFPVHMWSWKSGLAATYTNPVHLHFLDDYFEELVSYETTFSVDPAVISPSTLVILDPFSRADTVKDIVARLKAPVYQYNVAKQRPMTSSQDLVIVPAFQASNWCINRPDDLLQTTKTQLDGHGFSVLSYTEYVQQYCEDNKSQLTTSDSFKELPGSLWGFVVEDGGADSINDDSDTAWITVNRQQRKGDQQRSRKRCGWRGYCKNGLHCRYIHTKDEENSFMAGGCKTATKYRLCRYQDCYREKQCFFAHSKMELFCPTCDKTGAGHGMENCPERYT